MIKIGFGNRVKNKTFDYIPRFYDPVKEELKERLQKYKESDDPEEKLGQMKDRIKSGMRLKYYGDASVRKNEVNQSNKRLLMIIIGLFLIAIVLLQSDKILSLVEAFSR
jgi:hypothetical protein